MLLALPPSGGSRLNKLIWYLIACLCLGPFLGEVPGLAQSSDGLGPPPDFPAGMPTGPGPGFSDAKKKKDDGEGFAVPVPSTVGGTMAGLGYLLAAALAGYSTVRLGGELRAFVSQASHRGKFSGWVEALAEYEKAQPGRLDAIERAYRSYEKVFAALDRHIGKFRAERAAVRAWRRTGSVAELERVIARHPREAGGAWLKRYHELRQQEASEAIVLSMSLRKDLGEAAAFLSDPKLAEILRRAATKGLKPPTSPLVTPGVLDATREPGEFYFSEGEGLTALPRLRLADFARARCGGFAIFFREAAGTLGRAPSAFRLLWPIAPLLATSSAAGAVTAEGALHVLHK